MVKNGKSDPSTLTQILDRETDTRKRAEVVLLKAGALQHPIFNSVNFSSITTDTNGVIQIFNVGTEHMLGYPRAARNAKTTSPCQ